jgi:hypothetical protein
MSIKSEIEKTAEFKFDTFEPVLVSYQNAGSYVYKVKICIGKKFIHTKVVRHKLNENDMGRGKNFEILDV